jgi:hypothetical protein
VTGDVAGLLAELGATPAQLAAEVNAADAAALDRRPPAGGWSLRELVARMADMEFNLRWSACVARILAEPEPDLPAVEPELRAIEHGYRYQDPRVAVGAFTMARKHLLGQLSSLPAAAWARRGVGPDGRACTLAEVLSRFAAEDRADLDRIRALRLAAADGDG